MIVNFLKKQKEQLQNKNYSNDKNVPENGNKKINKKEDYDLIGLFGSQAMDMLGLQSQELQKSQTNQFKTSEVDINNQVLGEEIDEKIQEINIKAVEKLLQTQKKLQDQQKQLNQAGDDQEIFIDIRHSSPINADEKKMVRDLVFLDGNRIATCSVDKQIIIWQQNGQKIQQKKMHKKFIQQLAYSSNFGLLASVDIGGTLIVWKDNYHATLQNTNSQPVKKYDEKNGGIEYIIGQNNCHKDNTYSVIFLDQLYNNNNNNNNNQLQLNQEQQLIATSGNDNCVKIWKINKNSLDLLYVLKNQSDICFSVLNNTVRREIISGGDGNILIWKDPTQQLTNDSSTKSKKVVKEQQQIYEVKSFKAHSGYINQMILQISNQSPVIFTCSDDQTVKIWDAYSYNLLNVLEESMSIGSICYIDISQILVVGLWDENSESGGICFWAQGDDDQYEQIQQVEKVKSGVTSVKINYENNLLISSHLNGKLEIFSLKYEVVNS
ncbi:WD40-repeat-containing domain [Pseudocohnilembus persalinus]|uniref:WD40-repeat-containing domain n=1 Tax=Pseudocohnilembus persalinus TaxID=266149 RepID=A0A0V0QDM9_PSEPJ|nr:WD40-repeat-containing domain [Pseudocohnilembus persalinus]|eukprot:KRX00229.1 WD40-repeat-containing domain [Pseudocohnilembus persalinus]